MRRLVVRFTLSHLVVAIVGGAVTFAIVWWLAPALFDAQMGLGMGRSGNAGGPGQGYGQSLRASFASAVTTSLAVGTLSGAVVAAISGLVLARTLARPLTRIGRAVSEMAQGRYEHSVPIPRERELASLAGDVNVLGSTLASTEQRRLRLLGEVAHEMRTPLTVIDGYVEAFIDGVVAPEPEQLELVSTEVRRLRRLSDDLSALSRAEEGRFTLAPAPVDLDQVASDVVERLRSQADDKGITVSSKVGAVTVVADPDRTVQVLTNLVGNAIRATGRGGRITIAGSRAGDEARLSVEDTGVGLSAADLVRVFERFYRVPGQESPSDGSGIGLTVSRAYMRAMGGDLLAQSDGLGAGATFTMVFPSATRG
ncbi:MAG TPA: HAMP domain-containing sensor histidine kinase [Propionibacteriaceae bacterium]|nr:HAMP domain-containing sensor histidine kinase [Propionibacteriaceae bacterium]